MYPMHTPRSKDYFCFSVERTATLRTESVPGSKCLSGRVFREAVGFGVPDRAGGDRGGVSFFSIRRAFWPDPPRSVRTVDRQGHAAPKAPRTTARSSKPTEPSQLRSAGRPIPG